MSDAPVIEQIKKDGDTWVPVAFFSYFEENGKQVLHQLWASVLGNTKWEPVEVRNIKEMSRVYAECQVYGDTDARNDDLEL
jgi:hypothetical protein